MSSHSLSRCLTVGMVLVLGSCLGCGTKRYEEKLQATVKGLREGSDFATKMHPPKELAGTKLTIQLPTTLPEAPFSSGDAEGQQFRAVMDLWRERAGEAAVAALKTPIVLDDLPGLKQTHEGFVEDEDSGKMYYYCYVGAADPSESKGAFRGDPLKWLRTSLRGDANTSMAQGEKADVGDWESVYCQSSAGGRVEWQKIRVTCPQDFCYVDSAGKGALRRLPGTIEFYARSFDGLFVYIGWQVPSYLEGHMGLEKWGPAVAGSVTVQE